MEEKAIIRIKSNTPFFSQYEKQLLEVEQNGYKELVLTDCDGNSRCFREKNVVKRMLCGAWLLFIFYFFGILYRLKNKVGGSNVWDSRDNLQE